MKEESGRILKQFTGGSLSGTFLMECSGEEFVRKTISLTENREYGFFRWYSQLKRLQRLGALFPGVFPRVLRYGKIGKQAYFDIEYIKDAQSGFTFLANNPEEKEVKAFFTALIKTMDTLHAKKRPSCTEALELYVYEEIERPLEICKKDPVFREFSAYKTIVFNGKEVPSMLTQIKKAYQLAARYFENPWECSTHGNLTLENTLWVPNKGRVWFIDPYEENVLDTVHNEYSQLLQSCNSYYELYNSKHAIVEGNTVKLHVDPQPGIDSFNKQLWKLMRERFTPKDLIIIRLYEVSQFTRMLPFKLHAAKEKMVFFYALASARFHELLEEESHA